MSRYINGRRAQRVSKTDFRTPGEPLPEAAEWRALPHMVGLGWVLDRELPEKQRTRTMLQYVAWAADAVGVDLDGADYDEALNLIEAASKRPTELLAAEPTDDDLTEIENEVDDSTANLTKKELIRLAEELGIEVKASMKKDEIREAIAAHE